MLQNRSFSVKIPKVVKTNVAGGEPFYFINGKREDSVYDDASLLRFLIGTNFSERYIVDSNQLDAQYQEGEMLDVHIQAQAALTLGELDDILQEYPELDATDG